MDDSAYLGLSSDISADFSLGLDVSFPDSFDNSADFSLGLDVSFSDSDDDNQQDGGNQNYTIHRVRERLIRKFDVYGYDYRVHVEAFDRDIDFTVAVQRLHGILSGWYTTVVFIQ